MFWWLWNYLKGYVIIKVSGFSVERFINLSALKGYIIWDIKSFGRDRMMKASYKDIENIFETAKKCGCSVEVMEGYGLPFKAKKAGKKRVFSVGVIIFALAIFILTRFVWIVEVEGNKSVTDSEILEFCKENGVYPGSIINRADFRKLGQDIIIEFDSVNWAAVNIKGTKVIVSVSEKLPQMDIIEPGDYASDIIAKKDGIIESIMTEKGTAVVKAGDVVEKGDVLIEGQVILKDGEVETGRKYEKAQGTVMAKTAVEFETRVNKNKAENVLTGETGKYYKVTLGEAVLTLFKPDENKLYNETTARVISPSIGDFKIPFDIEIINTSFYEEKEKSLTSEEALNECYGIIESKKEELLNSNAFITDQKDEIYETDDEVIIHTYISLIENIGEEVTTNNIRGDMVTDGTKGDINSR